MKDTNLARMIVFDGADSERLYYHTPSWTTPGLSYDMWIERETGNMHCECMDAVCRRKQAYVLDALAAGGCKHLKQLAKLIRHALKVKL